MCTNMNFLLGGSNYRLQMRINYVLHLHGTMMRNCVLQECFLNVWDTILPLASQKSKESYSYLPELMDTIQRSLYSIAPCHQMMPRLITEL